MTAQTHAAEPPTYTRAQFMEYELVMGGAPHWAAREATEQAARSHPNLAMDREMTWAEWIAQDV